MCRQAVSQLRRDPASLGQNNRCKGGQLVAVLVMAGEREYLGAQSHKLDSVFVIPPQHLDNVLCISKTQSLHIFLAQGNIGFLVLVRPVLDGMFWL